MNNLTKKKKLIIIIVSIVAAVAAIGAGTAAYGYDVVKKNSIGSDKAVSIVMEDAGISQQDAVVKKAKLSFDDGRFVYDVEIVSNGAEYDYELKAADGTIIKKDIDANGGNVNNQNVAEQTAQQSQTQTTAAQTSQAQTQNNTTNAGDISLEKAKNVALENAGVKADAVTFTKAELDYDDGASHYDIEFYNSSYKYEYEIDMKGEIISYDRDSLSNQSVSQDMNSKYIGIDKAKSLALENAGKKSSDVNFTKAKLERDDGVWKYEIEFVAGTTEYEYDIDAISGKVLSHDVDSVYD